MEKAILIIVIICITVGCTSANKEQNAKEIAYEVLGEIIKPNDLTSDSIYVVMPFGGKIDYHEIYISKSIVPIHLDADFEIDTINGMKILYATWKDLKDTAYYKKSIEEGIVVLDNRVFWEEDRLKNLVIIQCMKNNERGIYKLVDYEEGNNKSQIISTLCGSVSEVR